jgi:osomolarity two-component system, response regulator SKN7
MNDVLPKPFTKEGLLTMLEKHLSHLKRHPAGLEVMPAPPHPKTNRSLKSDESPATSPATASNWNSPNNLSGVSPSSNHPDESVYSAGPYPVQAGMQPAPMYAPAPPMGAPPRQPPPGQRRGIGDISGGGAEMGDVKRQQLYPPQSIPHPMQQQTPMHRPPPR